MLEMYKGMVNSPETTITNDINAEDTIIYVLDETKVPEPPNLMTLGTGTSAETVKVLEVNGNALTVERGFQGVPRSWNAGTVIARNFTEYDYNALVENVKTLKENTDTNADELAAHKAEYASDLNSRLNGVYKVGGKHFNILRTPSKNTNQNVFKIVTDIQTGPIGGLLIRVTGQENLGKPIMFLIRINTNNFSLCKYSSINQETPEIKISQENNNVVLWFNHVGSYIAYVFDVLHSYSPYSNTRQWEVFEVEPSQIPAEAVSIPLYE